MSTAAATNRVTAPVHSHSHQQGGITVNTSIPVGGLEPWRREAIQKVIGFAELASNWDAQGSEAPVRAVIQTAIDFLIHVPGRFLSAPLVVPVSGGGYHFSWSVGDRELEISIESDCRIDALQVENGMPIEDGPDRYSAALFDWLTAA